MFAKSKKITYRELISALIVRSKDGKKLKLTYKTFLKGIENPSLLSFIVATIRGRPYIHRVDSLIDMEDNYFKKNVFDTLAKELEGTDLQAMSTECCVAMIRYMLPASTFTLLGPDFLDTRKPVPVMSSVDLLVLRIYQLFLEGIYTPISEDYDKIRETCQKVPALKPDGTPRMLIQRGVGLVPYPPVYPTYSTPTEKWIELSANWDRVLEVLQLPVRASEKLERASPKVGDKKKREVPLKAFKIFFKIAFNKPNFSAYKVWNVKEVNEK